MKKQALTALMGALVVGFPAAAEPLGELRVGIRAPRDGALLDGLDSRVPVEGGASIFGGIEQLDLFLVIDTSKSLRRMDPVDYRARGAIALVRSLPSRSDIQIGVVDFDRNAELVAPLSPDRAAAVAALGGLDRRGTTDLAAGIRTALAGFDAAARPGSSRVVLLFTDGKSDEDEAFEAVGEARRSGVAIHTLVLGSDRGGSELLRAVAERTGGSFVPVTDPSELPEAFLNLRTTGVERVTLAANGGPSVPASLSGGTFTGDVELLPGTNRIVATATSLDGETRSAEVSVYVSDEFSVGIQTPLGDTLYTDHESEVVVQGSATLFAGAAPEQLGDQPDHGVRRVLLRVDDSPPFPTTLSDGRFEGRVTLHEGENRILATATALDGRVREASVRVAVRAPGCGVLAVEARRDGQPALSIADRAVALVVDASNSMWAQIDGRPRMAIAQEILDGTLDALPSDLSVALRVYGHQHPREQRDCRDSELLVPFAAGSRETIRRAIHGFKPRGQTPLGYSLEQVSGDFGDFVGERAVVLVTDGVESCGGDPVAAARALQTGGSVPVHVIGFGLGDDDPSSESLAAIAEASGGRYLTAASAEALREALSVTVGTPYRVTRAGSVVAEGALGSGGGLLLPAGDYTVELASQPPQRVPVQLSPEQATTLVLDRQGAALSHASRRSDAEYVACSAAGTGTSPASME